MSQIGPKKDYLPSLLSASVTVEDVTEYIFENNISYVRIGSARCPEVHGSLVVIWRWNRTKYAFQDGFISVPNVNYGHSV